MLTSYKTLELIISTLLFVILLGFFRTFLLNREINVTTIMYDTLLFFIWYGLFLNA